MWCSIDSVYNIAVGVRYSPFASPISLVPPAGRLRDNISAVRSLSRTPARSAAPVGDDAGGQTAGLGGGSPSPAAGDPGELLARVLHPPGRSESGADLDAAGIRPPTGARAGPQSAGGYTKVRFDL